MTTMSLFCYILKILFASSNSIKHYENAWGLVTNRIAPIGIIRLIGRSLNLIVIGHQIVGFNNQLISVQLISSCIKTKHCILRRHAELKYKSKCKQVHVYSADIRNMRSNISSENQRRKEIS